MRLFIAIELDPAWRDALIRLQSQIDTHHQRIRWASAAQLHLTLKFLGETPTAQLGPITTVLQEAAQQSPHFEIQLQGTGCFPPSGAVRIVWVGGTEPTGNLSALVERLETDLARLGFKKEMRTFSIHFTIGRVKSDLSHGKLRQAVLDCCFGPCAQRVQELVLFRSELSPKGAIYTPLVRAALSGAK